MPDFVDEHGVRQDLAWLRYRFGRLSVYDAGVGPKFMLKRVQITTKVPRITVRVLAPDGQPKVKQPVANSWPDSTLEALVDKNYDPQGGLKTVLQDRALWTNTDEQGYVSFDLGDGSLTHNAIEGGPHTVWVLSPTLPSDGLLHVGFNTDFVGPAELTFQETAELVPSVTKLLLREILSQLKVLNARG